MTVQELISKLQTMNPEAVVLHGDGEGWNEGYSSINSVEEEARVKQQPKTSRKVVLRK